jgi:hypothetical protein
MILAGDHVYVGDVQSEGMRMADVMGDCKSDYLVVHDADIFRVNRHDCCVRDMAQTVLPKRVVSVVVLSDQHEAPRRRMDYFCEKEEREVFVAVDGYDIKGKFQMHHDYDSTMVMLMNLTSVVALTEAQITSQSGESMDAPVALINRAAILSLSLQQPAGVV